MYTLCFRYLPHYMGGHSWWAFARGSQPFETYYK